MDVSTSFVADAKSAELVQPAQCALDDTAEASRSAAMARVALGDHRLDPANPQEHPMTVGVVHPIGEEATRFVTWVTRPAKEAQPVVDAISLSDGGELVAEHGTFALSSAHEPVQDEPMGARPSCRPRR